MSAFPAERAPLLATEKPHDRTTPQPPPSQTINRNLGRHGFDYPVLLGLFNTVALFASAAFLLVCLFYFLVGAFFWAFGCFPPSKSDGDG